MTYVVLARRYRSQDFDSVVGQEPIARTLQNAIKTNRVAHAYLFCGTRGVGKTSMARIFAKALNGGSAEVDAAIMAGRDTDTIEIDAASNTGVDNVRDLIANANHRVESVHRRLRNHGDRRPPDVEPEFLFIKLHHIVTTQKNPPRIGGYVTRQ